VGPRELLICSVFRTTRMCTEQWCFASSTRAASKHICRRTSRRAGGTGVAWWSPGSGLVRVTGKVTGEVVPLPPNTTALPPVHVVGPYVVLGRGAGRDTQTPHLRDRRRHPLGCDHVPAQRRRRCGRRDHRDAPGQTRDRAALSVPGLIVMRELRVCQHHSDFSVRTVQLKMALP
jgi:hypothetical protein